MKTGSEPRRSSGNIPNPVLLAAWMVFVSAAAYPAVSETLDPILARRIDDAVLRVLQEDRAPSASIAIVRDGRMAYAAAYGRARLAPEVRATPETRYQLASISKTLTAEVLLLLEEDGKLSLDDPLIRPGRAHARPLRTSSSPNGADTHCSSSQGHASATPT